MTGTLSEHTFLMEELVQNKITTKQQQYLLKQVFYTATTFSGQILFQQRYIFKRGTSSHGDIILSIIIVLLLF